MVDFVYLRKNILLYKDKQNKTKQNKTKTKQNKTTKTKKTKNDEQ